MTIVEGDHELEVTHPREDAIVEVTISNHHETPLRITVTRTVQDVQVLSPLHPFHSPIRDLRLRYRLMANESLFEACCTANLISQVVVANEGVLN